VHTSPTKRSSAFVIHLEQLDQLFGPSPAGTIRTRVPPGTDEHTVTR
jgi:hypothetical protein